MVFGVGASVQKVDRGDISPRRRHQVRVEFRELRPVYVTYPLAVHLEDIFHWEGSIIEPMLDLQRGAEFSKLVVEESRAGVRHVA